ncbi:SET domain-containing protein [Lichtheimia hyalospora FSU 10163]|nr:SET domain-containing protein [Lichtheimia hyalospora FSU 10163]
MMSESTTTMGVFLKWLENNGVTWNKELVEIRPTSTHPGSANTSYACYALKDCKEGDVIAWIPRSSLLSSKTTAIADKLEEKDLTSIQPESSLALALMDEMRANDSPWKGYIKSLPSKILTPLIWKKKDKKWLFGTEMEKKSETRMQSLWDDYEQIKTRFPYSFSKFCIGVLLVRALMLQVDHYHRYAMVPFMNLLMKHDDTHKGQARLDVDGVAVCQDCGKVKVGKCSSCTIPLATWVYPYQRSIKPLDDLEALEEAGVNFYNQHPPDDQGVYRVVLTDNVKKGDMIGYDYGPQSSADMLDRYGFCYKNNSIDNETFTVSRDLIQAVCVDVVRNVMFGKQRMTSDATKRATEHVYGRFRFYCDNYRYLLLAFTNHNVLASIFGKSSKLRTIHEEYTAINGRYQDDLLALFHIVFANDALFKRYESNVFVAVGDMRRYLSLIYIQEHNYATSKKRVHRDPQLEQLQYLVYNACHLLSYYRRACYEEKDAQLWIHPDDDEYCRDQEILTQQESYALTCRINEKRVLERSFAHYDEQLYVCIDDDEDVLDTISNKRSRTV